MLESSMTLCSMGNMHLILLQCPLQGLQMSFGRINDAWCHYLYETAFYRKSAPIVCGDKMYN